MSIACVGSFFQADSINDRHFVRKGVDSRRARFASGESPGDDLPRRREAPAPSSSGGGRLEEQATTASTPPASAQLRRSTSEPRLAGSTAASSHASRWSRGSTQSLRSKIGEAVEREVERSALGDYVRYLTDKQQRHRTRNLEMPLHLRVGPNPLDMGCPRDMQTEVMRAMTSTAKYARDPKWSTDLKRVNDRVGQRLEYQQRLSGPSGLVPELPHMQPKRYVSNPPTPYFVPGQRPR